MTPDNSITASALAESLEELRFLERLLNILRRSLNELGRRLPPEHEAVRLRLTLTAGEAARLHDMVAASCAAFATLVTPVTRPAEVIQFRPASSGRLGRQSRRPAPPEEN